MSLLSGNIGSIANKTIAAISTPPGMGGIGIVRISGSQALIIAERVFRTAHKKKLESMPGYTGVLGRVFDENGDIDDAIAFIYRAPKSYTGENVVELSCHGGVWAVKNLLRLCLNAGAAPAMPGEFTMRAFLNGKMALSDAEAVADLISAQGETAMRAALAGRDGALSTEIDRIVEDLLEHSAHLAAWADYPDDDIAEVDIESLCAALASAIGKMNRLLESWNRGRILREGVNTAIVGRPNVGKSTLMNLLAGEQRSIVTDVPGTTRDIVEETVRLGDCVLRLADTAGIHESDDPVEKIGIDMAKRRLDCADLILAVFDSSDTLTEQDDTLLEMISGRACIAVVNKIDLPKRLDTAAIERAVSRTVNVSAASGQGREELEAAVRRLLELENIDPSSAMLNTERQRRCVISAHGALKEAEESLKSGMTLDAVNVSLDYALDALLSLTGRRATDAVVDEVFSRFCVGK